LQFSARPPFDGPDLIFKRTTVWQFLSPDHKLGTYAIDDPSVEGVTCHFTVPEKGGWTGCHDEIACIALKGKRVMPIRVLVCSFVATVILLTLTDKLQGQIPWWLGLISGGPFFLALYFSVGPWFVSNHEHYNKTTTGRWILAGGRTFLKSKVRFLASPGFDGNDRVRRHRLCGWRERSRFTARRSRDLRRLARCDGAGLFRVG
jgi:hypothetical protein